MESLSDAVGCKVTEYLRDLEESGFSFTVYCATGLLGERDFFLLLEVFLTEGLRFWFLEICTVVVNLLKVGREMCCHCLIVGCGFGFLLV